MADDRYTKGSDNGPLRLALYEQWKSRCYRCSRPIDLIDIQIDHIIPASSSAPRIAELQAAGDLPAGFDLNSCENLAPICGRCNREKSGHIFESPRLGYVLEQAREFGPKVRRRVAAFHAATELEAHLLGVTYASFNEESSRALVREHGEIVVQRIALVDESLADYFSVYEVDSISDQGPPTFSIPINTRGRTAVTLLEDLLYTQLDDAFADGMDDLITHTLELISEELQAIDVPTGYLTVGEPTLDVCDALFDSFEFTRTADKVWVSTAVNFVITASASVLRDADDGDGSYELQGDGVVEGSGRIVMTWPIASERHPGVGSFDIDTISCEVSTSC